MRLLRDADSRTWTWPLAAVLWLAITAWLRPLTLPDEGRYVGVAWEMVRSGNWLVPTLDGLPYFHKPPLMYWITGLSLQLFGMNEFAARLAPLLGAASAATALFLFARRWAGLPVARAALIAFVTQPILFISAQFANLDMLVAGCIAVTILSLAHCVLAQPDEPGWRRVLLVAYLFAALGMLAKGLIGFVLPGMVIVAWLVVERRWRTFLRLLSLPGLVLFVVVAAPWFIAMQQRFPDFMHYFFVVQHFQRYASGGFNNAQPLWFFPAVILGLALPWSLWALSGVPTAVRPELVERTAVRPELVEGHAPIRRLMWLWLLLIMLFFSLPQSKLVGYILPITAPLAFLAGDAVVQFSAQRAAFASAFRVSVVLAAIGCIGFAVVSPMLVANPQRDLGEAMRGKVAPGDRVVFLDDYYFALSFYAQLREPVIVIADWSPESGANRDNWRKELLDAARFAPESKVLQGRDALDSVMCIAQRTWIVGSRGPLEGHHWRTQVSQFATSGPLGVWVTPVQTAQFSVVRCRGTPILNSAGRS